MVFAGHFIIKFLPNSDSLLFLASVDFLCKGVVLDDLFGVDFEDKLFIQRQEGEQQRRDADKRDMDYCKRKRLV